MFDLSEKIKWFNSFSPSANNSSLIPYWYHQIYSECTSVCASWITDCLKFPTFETHLHIVQFQFFFHIYITNWFLLSCNKTKFFKLKYHSACKFCVLSLIDLVLFYAVVLFTSYSNILLNNFCSNSFPY